MRPRLGSVFIFFSSLGVACAPPEPAAPPSPPPVLSAPLAPSGPGAPSGYRKPPKEVLDVLHAPHPPTASVSPTHDAMILATPVRFPPIAELAEPMLRLAGARVLPKNHGLHGTGYFSGFVLTRIPNGAEIRVALPAGARVTLPRWSADGRRFAFENLAADAVELYVGEAATGAVRRVPGVRLNPVLGSAVQWGADGRSLVVKIVPRDQGAPPPAPPTPFGPDVQETSGQRGASSTYEVRDVLKSKHDEDLFDYYAASQIAIVDAQSLAVAHVGAPGLYDEVRAAPDGRHLLVETVRRPYSYLAAFERFPHDVEVWETNGRPIATIASQPLADAVPIWGVRTGARDFAWRPNEPATLTWAEALDGGDWNRKAPERDRVLLLRAPFNAAPVEILRTEQRFEGLTWIDRPGLALVEEHDAIRHWRKVTLRNVDDPKVAPRVLVDQSSDDRYKNPGAPVTRVLPSGHRVVLVDGDAIFLSGAGASPEGDRPFLDRLELATLRTERLFRSDKAGFEQFVAWIDPRARTFLTRRESPNDPPNYFVRTLGAAISAAPPGEASVTSTLQAVTHMADPTPEVRGITKRLVKYKRADGVDLSFTLYLPPGYKEGTRLPTIVWAYPLDYADAKMAGQVSGSDQRFTVLGWPLHLFALLEGYAVLDNPSLPVVGDTNHIYDTYMEQLVAGAKAAVDKAVELGVTDRDRIGITGHSHGALMTANLLAHSDLFRAGVARSGAYNRSLTAFGFQSERRTLWEAQDVYIKVSPLFSADKLKLPLLLIHGEADVNPGTTPIQSEKLFEALRGTGGTARLVMLPFESHGYQAMESTEHVLYEMLSWFDKYVKNAPPRTH